MFSSTLRGAPRRLAASRGGGTLSRLASLPQPVSCDGGQNKHRYQAFTEAAFLATAFATALGTAKSPLALDSAEAISISSSFDSGNIEVVSVGSNSADLNLVFEPYTEGTDKTQHAQWFFFRASNVQGKACAFRVLNAGKASYAPGYVGYRACCSYDRKTWFRVPTSYDEKSGVMNIDFRPTGNIVWVAYFAPFTYEQHQSLIARCARAAGAQVRSIGKTLDGREIDVVTAGSGKLNVWITARQHPGETQAEHWAEGFLGRLLDADDAKARRLKTLCTFHVVPNANPDGSVRGHLRTNAAGANLNREWACTGEYEAPTLKRSPEVYHLLREMDKTGVDFFLDVHGDENIPHCFLAGTHGVKCWDDRLAWLHQSLAEAYQGANPDFGNLNYNYGNDNANDADMRCADAQIAQRFRCLAATLEMPYKDCYDTPQPKNGWSPARCKKLGASFLDALDAVVTDLRRDFSVDPNLIKPWNRQGYQCPPAKECSWE